LVGGLVRNTGVLEFSEQASFLSYGRVVDTRKLRTVFGYVPRYNTEAALRSFVESAVALPRLASGSLSVAAQAYDSLVLEPSQRRRLSAAGAIAGRS